MSSPPGLADDIILELFDCLAPSPLLALVACSKQLAQALTHEHVLKSVLLHGGSATARKTLRIMMGLLSERQIFTPSALRLLRLACGKTCERIVPDGTACNRRPPGVRPDYGVFWCWPCLQEFGTTEVSNSDPRWTAIRKNRRTCANEYTHRTFLWDREYLRAGERCGPLVTVMTADRLRTGAISVADSLRVYLDGATTDPSEIVARFNALHTEALEADQRAQAHSREAAQARAQSKQSKIDAMDAKLAALLGDAPWVPLARASQLHARLTEPLRKAPSKATGKALKEVAAQLREKFAVSCEQGALGHAFHED